MNMEPLIEQLKTIHNLVEISLLLIKVDKELLLPTVLELLLVEAQQIVDDYCVVKDGSNS